MRDGPLCAMASPLRTLVLLGPGLGWLALFLVIPCGIVFFYSFFDRGIYGGIVYTFTLDVSVAPTTGVDFLTIDPTAGPAGWESIYDSAEAGIAPAATQIAF